VDHLFGFHSMFPSIFRLLLCLLSALAVCRGEPTDPPASAPARFDSALELDVYVATPRGREWLGQTPTPDTRGLEIGRKPLILEARSKLLSDGDLLDLIQQVSLHNVSGLNLKECRRIRDPALSSLEGLPRLRTLSFCQTNITDDGLEHIAGLASLAELDLSSCQGITDAGLAHLKRLAALASLGLSGCREITDTGMSHLRGLGKLTTLRLGGTAITGAGLGHLAGMPSLQSLDLSGCRQIANADLARVAGLRNLRLLNLRNCRNITDAGVSHLKALKQLGGLDLSRTSTTAAVLGQLAALPELSELTLQHTQVTDSGLARLRELPKLQVLDLGMTRITNAGLAHLGRLTELRELALPGCRKLTDEGLKQLHELRNLGALSLAFTGVNGSGLRGLQCPDRLRSLDLSYTRFGDGTSDLLDKAPQLERLYLAQTPIRNTTMERIGRLTRLRVLDLAGCEHFNDAGLARLQSLRGLKMIDLQGTKWGEGAKELRKALPRARILL